MRRGVSATFQDWSYLATIARKMKQSQGYDAVILAGGTGSRMIELTSSIPKCLLPVANKPMLWYPLNYLENAGFHEVTVIVPSKCLAHVQRLISTVYRFVIKIDLVGLPADQESCGTADALRIIADRIQNDLVVLSCDLITDFPLNQLLAAHHASDASVTCLFAVNAIHGPSPGPKSKRKVERDVIGLVPSDNQLAFMAAEDDLDEDSLMLSSAWISKFPKVNFTTKLMDCHLYIMKKWAVNALKLMDECSSIKADFLPYLISLQHGKMLSPELRSLLEREPLDQQAVQYSHNISADQDDLVKCMAYVSEPEETSFCARLNNYGSYFEANKQIVKLFPKWISQTTSSVPADCVVAQGAKVKGQIKRTVVGRDCVVDQNAKVVNSLIMDCVRVGAGAIVTNSIICHSADIGEKAEVKDSIIGTNQQVIPLGRVISEIIGDTSRMLDI